MTASAPDGEGDDGERETIVALSSGALPSGIAVVRISGPQSRSALARLAGRRPEPRRASLRRIRDAAGDTIDRGIVLFFEGPDTVTGEDVGEIHLHGGRAVVAACLAALTVLPGVRLARPGEFTRRAFENGRIDLTQAEGLADLLAAETEAQRRQAAARSGGTLRALYEGWMRRLVDARARLEASFDFAEEEDVGADAARSVRPAVAALAAEMRAHLGEAHRGEIIRDGYRVAIAGAPNAGKSSLLNALADRDVAIVSDRPGTTRDVIEVSLDLRGLAVRVFDTAGLRDTEDAVEAIGIERAHAAIGSADLVLFLIDAAGSVDEDLAEMHRAVRRSAMAGKTGESSTESVGSEAKRFLPVFTKIDLYPIPNRFGSETAAAISVLTGEGVPALIDRVAALAADAAGNVADAVPVRTRVRETVAEAVRLLEAFLAEPQQPAELAAEHLRDAGDRLGLLTGRIGVEDLLDVIFSQFCIGK